MVQRSGLALTALLVCTAMSCVSCSTGSKDSNFKARITASPVPGSAGAAQSAPPSGIRSISPSNTQVATQTSVNQGASLDWWQTDPPQLDSSGNIVVNNDFRIQGTIYSLPTVHPENGGGDRPGQDGLYTAGDLDVNVSSYCVSDQCTEYYVSVTLLRQNNPIVQGLYYIPFTGACSALYTKNTGNNIQSLNTFASQVTCN